jgi:hypothetical protein
MYILSQVLIGISDIFLILSMLSGKKYRVIVFLILSTIFFANHYICLKGWTGASLAGIEIIFLIIIYLLETKGKEKYNIYLSISTIIVSVILSIITWAGWISLLPMVAMIIYLLGMIFTNLVIVKTGTFIRLILNATYMLLLKSYLGAGLTIVILIFTIIGIVNDCKNKNGFRRKNNERN